MKCPKCGKDMLLTNNPNYKVSNVKNETHLVYVCKLCDESTKK